MFSAVNPTNKYDLLTPKVVGFNLLGFFPLLVSLAIRIFSLPSLFIHRTRPLLKHSKSLWIPVYNPVRRDDNAQNLCEKWKINIFRTIHN